MGYINPTPSEVAARRFYESAFVHKVHEAVEWGERYVVKVESLKERLVRAHQESRVELQDEAARHAFDLLAVARVHAEFKRIDAQIAQEACDGV